MNNFKRKRLNEAIELLEQAKVLIDEVKEEEQTSFDNLSEGLQQSEKGVKMEEAITLLEESVDSIDEILPKIQEAAE